MTATTKKINGNSIQLDREQSRRFASLLEIHDSYQDGIILASENKATRGVMEFTRNLSADDRLRADSNLNFGDCIEGLANLPESSIDLLVTSIPFEELFTYSGKLEDVGNNGSTVNVRTGRFALNMRFVVAQLLRVMRPGCNVCIHIQQLLAYLNQHGFIGRRDFRGAIIDCFMAGGFDFYGEVAIPKNPQCMAQRLNLVCLQFKTGVLLDSSRWAMAPNDYCLIFKKPGDNPYPVLCLDDPRREVEYKPWVTHNEWIKWAKGTWEDIQEIDILDGWRAARESDEERHVCPLQLEVIRRFILLYSNPVTVQPNVMVLDPFMGIGSTNYVAQACGRNCTGFELKESYFDQWQRNMKLCRDRLEKSKASQMPLFATQFSGYDEEMEDNPSPGTAILEVPETQEPETEGAFDYSGIF